ncbi:MAG: helix-turn-helix domain-containing protein, partial [Xanthomonadales bacterium]|nr:helix-turn-helix domain-containing protein [Xanthomonadales bacterium]
GGYCFNEDRELIDWVRSAAPTVRRICSVCSGALLLAAAGILKGRRATTHWMDAEELTRRFPDVRVEANQIFTEDRGVFTSGGITAGIDLALALIERDYTRQLALKVAKRMLVFLKRPGDQSQFSAFLEAQAEPGPFEKVLNWITEHLDEPVDSASLAARACMSERSFQRKFEAQYGQSVRSYLRSARVTKARVLLETTRSPMSVIARQCGFSSADAMRYAFSKELGVTPRDYRLRFA